VKFYVPIETGPAAKNQPPYQRVSFQALKRPVSGVNHLPKFSAEVKEMKERFEIYLYTPLGHHDLLVSEFHFSDYYY
jgi:hypothetical protein